MKEFIKKNIKLIILFVVIISVGVIGYTLATNSNTIGIEIASGNYSVVYTGSSSITASSLEAIYDSDLLSDSSTSKIVKIPFTVKGASSNPTSKAIIYDVSLTDLNLPSEFHSELLKWRLYKNNSLLSEGSFSYNFDSQVDNRMVLTNIQQDLPSYSSTADSYVFYIWISEQCTGDVTTCTEEQDTSIFYNNSFSGKLKIELSTESKKALVRPTGIQPNSPDLVEGLIPVVYDGTNWVKADSSNRNFSWYNYSNKEWANAVLVKDEGIDYTIKSKNVSVSNVIGDGYKSTNQGVKSSTSTSTFTITTGTTAGTLSFDYSVSSESSYDKLTITVNDGTTTTTVASAISGTKSSSYSVEALASTTYTIVATYTKDSSNDKNDDTATISNFVYPTGSTFSVTDGATYPWGQKLDNKIATNFTYDTSNSKYVLSTISSSEISTSSVGKYICQDITQSECSVMYKITEADTTVTKVEEYSTAKAKSNLQTTYKNASSGTIIPMDDILAFYVWIPRYKYKVWNISKQAGAESTYAYTAKTTGIDIVFEEGTDSTGTITCSYNYNVDTSNGGIDLSTTTAETCEGQNGDYYTHPAFCLGETTDGVCSGDTLKGFWIGKFELSSSDPKTGSSYGGGRTTSLTARVLPNVTSWRYNYLSYFNTVIQDMTKSSNIYGLSASTTSSHMLTNMEWGAVAYLTNSKYGRCSVDSNGNTTCTEVAKNSYGEISYYTTMTGCGPISSGNTGYGTTCNAYDTTLGMSASTTGNITGVYDMSGGAWEYVMGNISKVTTGYTFYPSNSQFSSSWYTTNNNSKFLTTYAYYTSGTNQTSYNRGRLGDATAEVVFSTGGSGGWYSDYAGFPYSSSAWFGRGGDFNAGSDAGVFYFLNSDGYYSSYSARPALAALGLG